MTKFSGLHLTPLLLASAVFAASGCSSSDPHDQPGADLPEEVKSALSREQNPEVQASARTQVVAASTELGLKMLRAQPAGDNTVVSPHSLITALAMAEAGALGATKSEMRAAMQLPADLGDALHPTLNALDLSLLRSASKLVDRASVMPRNDGSANTAQPGALAFANGLFQHHSVKVLPSYLDSLAVNYGAGVQLVDFGASRAATASINSWVGDKTRGLIADFFKQDLPGETCLVLLNALYFNGAFAAPFDIKQTAPRAFAAPSGSVQVESVRQSSPLRFADVDGTKLVELPFAGVGTSLALTVILPPGELGAYVDGLTGESLQGALAAVRAPEGASDRVELQLPKLLLKPSENMNFSEPLQALGMHAAFKSSQADFSAMTEGGIGRSGKLYVDSVEQRTTFDLNEYGVEASAATAVVMVDESASIEPEPVFSLRADRPFLVVLHDSGTGQILFLGRVTNPSAR